MDNSLKTAYTAKPFRLFFRPHNGHLDHYQHKEVIAIFVRKKAKKRSHTRFSFFGLPYSIYLSICLSFFSTLREILSFQSRGVRHITSKTRISRPKYNFEFISEIFRACADNSLLCFLRIFGIFKEQPISDCFLQEKMLTNKGIAFMKTYKA